MTWGFVFAAVGLYALIGVLGYYHVLPRSVWLLWRDTFLHLKGTVCVVRRHHVRSGIAGTLAPKGYRGVPMNQCVFCGQFWLKNSDAAKLGGK